MNSLNFRIELVIIMVFTLLSFLVELYAHSCNLWALSLKTKSKKFLNEILKSCLHFRGKTALGIELKLQIKTRSHKDCGAWASEFTEGLGGQVILHISDTALHCRIQRLLPTLPGQKVTIIKCYLLFAGNFQGILLHYLRTSNSL